MTPGNSRARAPTSAPEVRLRRHNEKITRNSGESTNGRAAGLSPERIDAIEPLAAPEARSTMLDSSEEGNGMASVIDPEHQARGRRNDSRSDHDHVD